MPLPTAKTLDVKLATLKTPLGVDDVDAPVVFNRKILSPRDVCQTAQSPVPLLFLAITIEGNTFKPCPTVALAPVPV